MSNLSRRELMVLAAAQASVQIARPATEEPHYWTACEAAEQIRRRKISSEELTRLCLGRIRQHDKKLNAFITLMEPLGLVEVSRTGVAAISRGPEPI